MINVPCERILGFFENPEKILACPNSYRAGYPLGVHNSSSKFSCGGALHLHALLEVATESLRGNWLQFPLNPRRSHSLQLSASNDTPTKAILAVWKNALSLRAGGKSRYDRLQQTQSVLDRAAWGVNYDIT
jgi:hypothetical protein